MKGWRLLFAAWGLLLALLGAAALYAFSQPAVDEGRSLVTLTPKEQTFLPTPPRDEAPPPAAEQISEPTTQAPEQESAGAEASGRAAEIGEQAPPPAEGEAPAGDEARTETPAESEADGVSPASAPPAPSTGVDPASIPVRVERRGGPFGPAWLRNATPFSLGEQRPLVAVVVTRLGLAAQQTRNAILSLPPEVALSFTPYARNLGAWIDLARSAGREVFLDLPMEGGPRAQDLGPYALDTELPAAENRARLDWITSRSARIVGLVRAAGEVYVSDHAAFASTLAAIRDAGLAYLDSAAQGRSSPGSLARTLSVPHLIAVSALNQGLATRLAVDSALALAEAEAMEAGQAVAIIEPSPVAYERLVFWASGLAGRGVALAPPSELILRDQERYLAEH